MSIIGYIKCYYLNMHHYVPNDKNDYTLIREDYYVVYEQTKGHCDRCMLISPIGREIDY